MERLPTEILQLVLENLVDFRDSENASKTCTLWRDILHPSKSSWLFGEVFPMIFEYLSKSDIIQCRHVSKQWGFAVDFFLENNAFHRPVSGAFPNATDIKTDLPVSSLEHLFRDKKLEYHYNFSNYASQTKIIRAARYHYRCPIIGRSLAIWELSDQSNLLFLEIFGHHVYFLKICIRLIPVKALETILKLVSYAPNLKTLRIEGILLENSGIKDNQQLSEFVQKFVSSSGDEKRLRLPKLEALQIFIMKQEICEYWNYCLLRCLSTEKLESLRLQWINDLTKLKCENIVDLSINVNSDAELENISPMRSLRLRRLSLELSGRVQSSKLLGFIKTFASTLRNLELNLQLGYFSHFICTNDDFPVGYKSFADPEIFKNIAMDLKRVTLKGIPPPSLNFLIGVCKSVEYLHVTMETDVPIWLHRYIAPDYNEEVDLLKKLIGFKFNQTPNTYESNVWQTMRRLKVLTFKWYDREFENRRDTYDKYEDKKLSA